MPAMIITCPHCTTRYRVSATALGAAARAVRCSNCGHLWTVQPPQVDQEADRPAQQRRVPATAETSPGRQPARQGPGRSFQKDQKKTEAKRKPPVQQGEASIGPNGSNEQPDVRAAPVIVAPTTDAAAPPTADGKEVAATTPPGEAGGGSGTGEPLEELQSAPPAAKLPETAPAYTATPDKKVPEKPASQSPPARRRRAALAAALAIALAITGFAILVLERDAVVAAASHLTALIGLKEPPGAGLEIGAVTSSREEAADGDVLVVQGTVSNPTDEARSLPGIRVSLFDTDDTELQHVMVVPDQEVLSAGESIVFSARLEQPAPMARRIKVTFAARSAST